MFALPAAATTISAPLQVPARSAVRVWQIVIVACFFSISMPLLFIVLIITVLRSCTLPGAKAGLAFMFKPDFTVLEGTGWIKVFAVAGSQMFFSLFLATGALIAYGSYLRRDENLERDSIYIPLMDTVAALLCGLAVLPAVVASGITPSSGSGIVFVSLQTVFESMHKASDQR